MEAILRQLAQSDLTTPIARLVLILLVLALTWLARRLARTLIVHLIDVLLRAITRIGKFETQFEEALSRKLVRPIEIMVIAIGGWVIVALLEPVPAVARLVNQVVASILIVVLFWALYQFTNVVAQFYVNRSAKDTSSLDETIVRFIRQVVILLIIVFAFTLVLQQWGLDVGGLVAGLGIASLAVALAAQDALANIISYFAILTDSPFKVGDFIIIENVVKGRVQEISFRTTRIRTVDHSIIAIPNQTVANANVINWSRVRKRRLDILLGLTYSTTADQIEQVIDHIRAMLAENEQVTRDRLVVEFVEFGESSLNIRATFLVKAASWEDLEMVKTDVNLKIMRILEDQGVSIAFPTRTLHIESGGFPANASHQLDEFS
ncbi:MAG: mechanosensitive ion channel family protein [Anaerolineae bacterium]|nr:mechanosensitive ion channel family protein [Anaerolineae bacterium]